ENDWLRVFQIWKGGLSIWGGVLVGVLAIFVVCRVKHYDGLGLIDAMAPSLALAQAIGRWGNYFNQELFGGPTDLPWGLEIDRAHRPSQYLDQATFHPTFLYESLWNLLVFVILMRLNKRLWLRAPAGTIFAAYLTLYSIGRVFVESLRVDPAQEIAGVRFNLVLFCVVFVVAGTWLLVNLRRTRPR
ncbi:MAG: hypothetical protein QOE98_2016, partial [Gaiellaceae bacterium]|nr:hypothetical protein [Gaiellaceae bacterium]